MKHSYHLRLIILFFVAVFIVPSWAAAQDHSSTSEDLVHQSEDFWASINFIKLKNELGQSLHISGSELDLFDQYLQSFIGDDRRYFFGNAPYGRIMPSDYSAYLSTMKQKYLGLYSTFVKVKAQFAAELAAANNKAQAANGPCTNIGFENGNLSGWTTKTGTACGTGNCTLATTAAPGCHVQVTNKTMVDPLVPLLPTVFPGATGGANSVRIENFQNGADQTSLSQTFLVTPTNNVFTYNYAVVLEDPVTGHTDDQRPFFEVRMYDQAGKEITCATYKRFASAAQLPDFIYAPTPFKTGNADGGCSLANNNGGGGGGAGNMELYYKPWSTVSIPLINYMGQNVTIVFTAGDCSKGAHLGYAYVDANCSMMNPLSGATICGNQSVNFTATPGFSSWTWQRLAPATVSTIATTESVSINTPGNYSLTMIPFSNNTTVCPTVQNFTVLEHCTQAITVTLCENPIGSGSVTGVNLNNYNAQILNYNTALPKTLVSWHNKLPANQTNYTTATGPGNRVGTPAAATSLTVANGSKFYAVINYNSPNLGSDTAVLNFVINPSPVLSFPPVGPLCVGSAPVNLSASPAGGTYSGSVSGTQFNPATAGSFVVNYSYTNPTTGCSNTISQTILVQPPPTVNAGPDQTLCGNSTSVALTGTATNTTGVQWTSNSTQGGTFSPNNTSSNVSYIPGANEKLNGATINVTLTAQGATSCPNASDVMVIKIVPQATVNAGSDQTLCAPSAFSLSGTSTQTASVAWTIASGSNGGTISSPASPNATYNTSAAERTNGATITLTFTGTANSPCPVVTDQVILKIIPVATVNAGPDQTVCATSVALAGTATNYSSIQWSGATGIASPGSLNTTYTPAAPSTVNLTLTAFAIAPCPNVTDVVTLTISPTATVNAGPDQLLCATSAASITLSGTATNASGGTTWTRNGSPIATNPGSPSTTYTPTATELSQGATITFTLTAAAASPCPAVSDQVIITIIPVATVNAGTDQLICASTGSFALAGTATNAVNGVKWTTTNGTSANIINPNSLNAAYLPTTAEKNTGASITMRLTATPQSPCTPVYDDVVLTISPVATVDAGADQIICGNTPSVALSGTSTNASGGVLWTSSGTGTIAGNTTPNATYTTAPAELSSGAIITMTLTATPANPCPVVSDQMLITIIPQATVNAGTDPTICASSAIVALSGTATHQTMVAWSGGNGIFSPANSLNTIYIPSATELINGAIITVTLTANAASPCPVVTDQAVITIVPEAKVDAGEDHQICASTTSVLLSGTSTNAASVSWTSSSDGIFTAPNSTNTTYNLSAAEIANGGTITLTFTVNAVSPCPPVTDEAEIRIVPLPVVDAGPDRHVCEDNPFVTLNGSVINASGGIWTGGGGNFNPGNQTLNAGYTVSGIESRVGVVTLTLTSVNDPLCTPATDAMQIFIHPLPVVNIGPDQKLCPESDPPAIFNAGPGAKFLWSTGDTTRTIAVTAAGNYSVVVTTAYGCASSSSANVTEVCPPRLFISNSFTPNGDKSNDDYNVYGAHFTNFHMFIFNRWGEIIFESKDRNTVWDGIYRGEPMPIGVYPWIITYTGDSEEFYGPYRLEGSVTVVR